MATITVTVVRTGQTIPTKNSPIADADLDAIVAAYQNDANASLGGVTATYAQVLGFAVTQWYNQMSQRVQNKNTVVTIPPPIVLS